MERKAVKIYTAPDNLQAEMILEVLGKNGIPGYKRDLGAAGIMNLYTGNSTFGEEIFVAEEDVPKAAELLEGMGLPGIRAICGRISRRLQLNTKKGVRPGLIGPGVDSLLNAMGRWRGPRVIV